MLRSCAKQFRIAKLENVVSGGKNGQDSIRNGLYDIASRHTNDDIVLIYDAIRPMVGTEVITDNIRVCKRYENAITVTPYTAATLKIFDSLSTEEQAPRDNLKITQTPQAFLLKDICHVHEKALKAGITNSAAFYTCTSN